MDNLDFSNYKVNVPSSIKIGEGNLLDEKAIERTAQAYRPLQEENYRPYIGPMKDVINDDIQISSDLDLNKAKSENQGKLEQAFNAFVMQGFVGIGVLGALEGFGDLYDIVTLKAGKSILKDMQDITDGEADDYSHADDYMYRNAFTSWVHDRKEDLNESFANYYDDPEAGNYSIKDGGLTHWSWYMQNLPSVFSFLSFMIPSGATVKGLSYLGKGVKLATEVNKLNKASKIATELTAAEKAAGELGKAAGAISSTERAVGKAASAAKASELTSAAESIGAGAINLTAEKFKLYSHGILATSMANQMFARDIAYQQEIALTQLFEDDDIYQEVINKNQSLKPYADNKEQVIKILANRAATRDWEWNIFTAYPMIGQVAALNNWYKTGITKAATRDLKRAARLQAESLLPQAEREAVAAYNNTFRGKFVNFFKDTDFSWGSKYQGYFDAALGNAINVVGEKEAANTLERPEILNKDNREFITRFKDYSTDGRLWDAAIWGLLGGVFSNAVGSTIGKLSFDQSEIIDEKIRKSDIDTWGASIMAFKEIVTNFKNGINIRELQLDNVGRPIPNPEYNEGNGKSKYLYKTLETDAEKQLAIEKEFDKLLFNMGLSAANRGNADLLKAFMQDKNVISAFVDAKALSQSEANVLFGRASNMIDKAINLYTKNIKYCNELGINPYISQIIANRQAETEFGLENVNNISNEINARINKEISNIESENFNREEFNKQMNDYVARMYLTAMRSQILNKYNFIKTKEGIDYDYERENLKNILHNLNTKIDFLGLDALTNETLNYMGRITYSFDEEGRVKIKPGEKLEYAKDTSLSDEYLAEQQKKLDTDIEKQGLSGKYEARHKELVNNADKFAKEHSAIAKLLSDKFGADIAAVELTSMLNVNDTDFIKEAIYDFTKIDKKANDQVMKAYHDIKSLMSKYDVDEVYDYLAKHVNSDGSRTEITGITSEDLSALDDMATMIGLNNKIFDKVIYDLNTLRDNLKQAKINDELLNNDNVDKEEKKQIISKYNEYLKKLSDLNKKYDNKLNNDSDKAAYKTELDALEKEYSDAKNKYRNLDRILHSKDEYNPTSADALFKNQKLKIGDEVAFIEPETDERFARKYKGKITEIHEGDKSKATKSAEEKVTRWVHKTKKIVDSDATKAKIKKAISNGQSQVAAENDPNNVVYKSVVSWTVPTDIENWNEEEYTRPSTPAVKDETTYTIVGESGISFLVPKSNITHIVQNSGKKKTSNGSKKQNSTIDQSEKKSGTESKKRGKKGESKTRSSTGGMQGANAGHNTRPGGVINVGDVCNVIVAGELVEVEEVVVEIDGDDVTFESGNEADISTVVRRDGYISPAGNEESNDSYSSLLWDEFSQNDPEYMNIITVDMETNGRITENGLNTLEAHALANKPTEYNDGSPVEISDEEWEAIVKNNINSVRQELDIVKKSTAKDFAFIDKLGATPSTYNNEISVPILYQKAVTNLIEDYLIKQGLKDENGKFVDGTNNATINIINVLRFLYKELGGNYNRVVELADGIVKYAEYNNHDAQGTSKDSNYTFDLYKFRTATPAEIYDLITKDIETLQEISKAPEQKFSRYEFVDGEGKPIDVNVGDIYSISVNGYGTGIDFYNKSGQYLGSIPTANLAIGGKFDGRYLCDTDGFVTDVYKDGDFYVSSLMDHFENWFNNYDGTHGRFLDILKSWIKTPSNMRTKQGTVGVVEGKLVEDLVKEWMNSPEYLETSEYHKNPGNEYEKENAVKQLNYLAKLYSYAYGPENVTGNFKLDSWIEKLYKTALLMSEVAANPTNFEAVVNGTTEGLLHYTAAEDRGYPKDRIAGYSKRDKSKRNPFRIGVSTSNGTISVSDEVLPQSFAYASKGNTFVVLPYGGSGLRNYVHAYPTSMMDLMSDNSANSKQQREIVNAVKSRIKNLLHDVYEQNDMAFDNLSKFLLTTFWNRQNSTNERTGFSLFRIRNDISKTTNSQATAKYTETSDNAIITLSAGKDFYITVTKNHNFKDGGSERSYSFSINGYSSEDVYFGEVGNIDEQIDNLFNQLAFDVNINFVLADGSKNKTFKDSLVSFDETGKFVVTVGEQVFKFNSYNDFLLDGNLVQVTTDILGNGTNFYRNSEEAQRYGRTFSMKNEPKVNVEIRQKKLPRRGNGKTNSSPITPNEDITQKAVEIVNSNVENKGEALAKLLFPNLKIFNEKGISLYPSNITFDESITSYNAEYDPITGVVTIGKHGYDALKNTLNDAKLSEASLIANRKFLLKKLIHERLHELLEKDEYKGNINQIEDIYNEYKNAIKDSKNKSIFEDIAEKHNIDYDTFVNDYLNKFLFEDAEHSTIDSKLEEFLIESLTNNALAETLNSIEVEDTGKKKVNLWTKIADFLLKHVLGIDVNKKSLLQKEINSLREVFSEKNSIFAENEISQNDAVDEIQKDSTNNTNNNENENNQETEVKPESKKLSLKEKLELMKKQKEDIVNNNHSASKHSTAMDFPIQNKNQLIENYTVEDQNMIKTSIEEGFINLKCSI